MQYKFMLTVPTIVKKFTTCARTNHII